MDRHGSLNSCKIFSSISCGLKFETISILLLTARFSVFSMHSGIRILSLIRNDLKGWIRIKNNHTVPVSRSVPDSLGSEAESANVLDWKVGEKDGKGFLR